MKSAITCFICLLIIIVCVFASADGLVAPTIKSSFLVHLSGAIIDCIDITFEMSSEESLPFAFIVPFKIIDNDIKKIPDSVLFDYQSFEDYSICICAPFMKNTEFKFTFSNDQKGIYNGLTLDGKIHNGDYDLELKIPGVKTNVYIDGMIKKFDEYCIIQDTPFSSLEKSDNGKRISIKEDKDTVIKIPIKSDDDITYRYTFGIVTKVDEYTLISVLVGIILPAFLTLFSVLFSDKDGTEKLRARQVIMNVIVFLFIVPTVFYWFSDTPILLKWFITVLELINIAIIVANNKKRIKAIIEKRKMKKKEK